MAGRSGHLVRRSLTLAGYLYSEVLEMISRAKDRSKHGRSSTLFETSDIRKLVELIVRVSALKRNGHLVN